MRNELRHYYNLFMRHKWRHYNLILVEMRNKLRHYYSEVRRRRNTTSEVIFWQRRGGAGICVIIKFKNEKEIFCEKQSLVGCAGLVIG